jgi:hypothetical protein
MRVVDSRALKGMRRAPVEASRDCAIPRISSSRSLGSSTLSST